MVDVERRGRDESAIAAPTRAIVRTGTGERPRRMYPAARTSPKPASTWKYR